MTPEETCRGKLTFGVTTEHRPHQANGLLPGYATVRLLLHFFLKGDKRVHVVEVIQRRCIILKCLQHTDKFFSTPKHSRVIMKSIYLSNSS